MVYSQKQWRCFDRCLLGLQKFRKLHKRVRFLTLTLPACNCVCVSTQNVLGGSRVVEHDSVGKKMLIQLLWRVLYQRMLKLVPLSFVAGGYMSYEDACYYYGEDALGSPMEFPYFSVRTPESNGVFHVVIACDWLPYDWIMENWVEIAGTCYVWICDPYDSKRFRRYKNRDRNPGEVAHYLMTQYLGDQPDFTYGFSSDWVYRGFSTDYQRLRSTCRNEAVEPLFVGYGMVVYPIDVVRLRESWDALMEKKVYSPDKGFLTFMRSVKECSRTEYGFPKIL